VNLDPATHAVPYPVNIGTLVCLISTAVYISNKWPSCLLGMADRTAHSRRSVQQLWRIHLAMLTYRDRGVKVKIRINVPVRVNPVQITARYSHSSLKTKPNPNTKHNPNPINTRIPVN